MLILYYSDCTFTNTKQNRIIIVSFLAATLLFSVYAPVQISAEFVVNNLGFAHNFYEIDGNIIVFVVEKNNQNNEELFIKSNSDVIVDQAIHVYDHSTGITTDLGLDAQIDNLTVKGTLVVFVVEEIDQNNTDLNGDGDTR